MSIDVKEKQIFAPGQRIVVREEDFLVTKVVKNYDDNFIITAEGMGEIVKGKVFHFDTAIDSDIQLVKPEATRFLRDESTGYRKTKLFIETQVRNAYVHSDKITVAHKAAFNDAAYQYTPTLKALKLPRPRMLIADGVGLGKTIEVGIFLTELIKRGRGKRIMVLALKSILTQFQQEMWNRFAIPLVRLDSAGVDRLKTIIPANKNPFDYYDKTIVSIDTLKNNAKFRHYIEKSRWDAIVIDECHTVSNIDSQRGDLASYLATKCESLVLASATPHNGKMESFANLINMIEPTAIPSNGKYEKKHIEPYYVRRFKNDIDDAAVRANFQDREIIKLEAELSAEELDFLQFQQKLKFQALEGLQKGKSKNDLLFSIGLFKSVMSSPAAALASVKKRLVKVKELTNRKGEDYEDSLEVLETLEKMLQKILATNGDSKYKRFKKQLLDLGWKGSKSDDRIVLFAERIDTLNYLHERLTKDFGLNDKNLKHFDGSLSDVEQQDLIDDFGKRDSDIRILLASNAAAEGVNLHYYCNHMFNYDIPWSLIKLDQRNGRIDRYGQTKTPYIFYLVGVCDDKNIRTDLHIVGKLIEKEEAVYNTLGDAGSVMNMFDTSKEEKAVEDAIIEGDQDYLEKQKEQATQSILDLLSGATPVIEENTPFEPPFSIFQRDEEFYKALFEQLESTKQIEQGQAVVDNDYIELLNTPELDSILFDLPNEAKPALNSIYKLTTDKALVQKSIDNARKKKGEWAEFQPLYELHPVIKYYMTKLEASVDKDVAQIAKVNEIPKNEAWYIMQAQVSNNLGQPVLADCFAIGADLVTQKLKHKPLHLPEFVEKFNLKEDLINLSMAEDEIKQLKITLSEMLSMSQDLYLHNARKSLERQMEIKLAEYKQNLKSWQTEATEQLEIEFSDKDETAYWREKRKDRERKIETIANESSQFYQDMNSLQNEAYIRVLAVFYNK